MQYRYRNPEDAQREHSDEGSDEIGMEEEGGVARMKDAWVMRSVGEGRIVLERGGVESIRVGAGRR